MLEVQRTSPYKQIISKYNMMIRHELDWPSLSIQWFSDYSHVDEEMLQSLLLSIHTSKQDVECLLILSVEFPIVEEVVGEIKEETLISQKNIIKVRDEVNRARHNPLMPNLIATRSDAKEVNIYDTDKYSAKNIQPVLSLSGHSKGGYGLDWNTIECNVIVSSGEDHKVCVFDLNKKEDVLNKKLNGREIKAHKSVVNDVCFNKINPNIFASVSDERKIVIHDLRTQEVQSFSGHSQDILCCEFNYFEEKIIATGSADSTTKIWDLRNSSKSASSLEFHSDCINQTRWSPHMKNTIATCSKDSKVCVWNIDEPKTPDFVHEGHTDVVNDISWNPLETWEIASVADDNSLQIWSKSR